MDTPYSAGGGIDGRCIWGQQGAAPVKMFWLDGHLNLPSLLREFSTNVYYAVWRCVAQLSSVASTLRALRHLLGAIVAGGHARACPLVVWPLRCRPPAEATLERNRYSSS